MARDISPELTKQVLIFGAVVEPGIVPTVVDIGAGLAAGCAMHVQDHPNTGATAPFDGGIEQLEAFAARQKKFVVERDANRIQTRALEKFDIGLSDVAAAVLLPKIESGFGADQFVEQGFDFARRLRPSFEEEHVTFGLEP